MPRYIALRDTWLSHECRLVKEGQEFETVFPKVKNGKGEEIGEMSLGDNLKLVEAEKPTAKKSAKGDESLA